MPKTAREQIGVDLPDDPTPDPQLPTDTTVAAEPPAEEPADERPDWLPEKYKTPEDMVASQKSLENELRLRGERERELTEQISELQAYQAQDRQPQQQSADPLEAFAAELEVARENGDTRREAELQAWLTNYNVTQALQNFQQRSTADQAPFVEQQHSLMAVQAQNEMRRVHEDWEDNKERIGNMLDENPDLLSEQAASSYEGIVRALDRAYTLVKAEDMAAELEDLRKQGVSAEDIGRARKLQAQTLPGASGRPGEPSEADKHLAEINGALRSNRW